LKEGEAGEGVGAEVIWVVCSEEPKPNTVLIHISEEVVVGIGTVGMHLA
jgi:hypothetical protein